MLTDENSWVLKCLSAITIDAKGPKSNGFMTNKLNVKD